MLVGIFITEHWKASFKEKDAHKKDADENIHMFYLNTAGSLFFSGINVHSGNSSHIFYLLEPETELIKHAPNRLYNCDDSITVR
jgi:hypothetical protein